MAPEDLKRDAPKQPLTLLLVEDSDDDADLIVIELRRNNFQVTPHRAMRRAEVERVLADAAIDLVLTDHAMPELSSLDVIRLVRDRAPCIVVSGAVGEETAVSLLKQGAVDYVNKGNLPRLAPAVRRALEEAQNKRARREAEEALRRANDDLERRVEERTAALQQSYRRLRQEMEERRRAEQEVRDARLKLTRLREDERVHLSREIHDGVVQDLLGICFAMADTERDILAGASAKTTFERVKGQRQEILEAVRRLRNLIKGLRPPGLEEFGLAPALDEFIATTTVNYAGVSVELSISPEGAQFSPTVSQCFFRVAQEAIRNALRHGRAKHIRVHIALSAAEATITVTDDGLGFTRPDRLGALAREDHFGLILMDEHAQMAGGSFQLETAPNQGTTIRVRIPLSSPSAEKPPHVSGAVGDA